MSPEPEVHHEPPQVTEESLPPAPERFTQQRAALDCASAARAWDLRPGDVRHRRTITSVRGEAGMGSNPVAVFSLTGDRPHLAQTRIGAARPDAEYGCDGVWRAARAWVRDHRLDEGDAVELDRLRTDVVSCFDCPALTLRPRTSSRTADTVSPAPVDRAPPEGTPAPG